MNVFLKKDYPVKWVPVGNLSVVYGNAQRARNERKVEGIVEDFDPDAFGTLVVTLPNGDGIYHVIDGQHRAEAVRRIWGVDENVPCQVLSTKSPAEAAAIWRKINGARTRPQAIDDFRVAVTEGAPDQVAVDKLIRGLGYKVGFDSTDGTLSAVSACLTIYRKHGGVVLKDALLVIQGTWGKSRDSVHQHIVGGYADMLAKHGPDVDRKRLVDRVSRQYTPARLLGAAKTAREMFRGTVTHNVRRALVSTYNHGLRTDLRLEEEA
jgi:hypothetical protein